MFCVCEYVVLGHASEEKKAGAVPAIYGRVQWRTTNMFTFINLRHVMAAFDVG